MTKVTWLGEEDGPDKTEAFGGIAFQKGKAVDVENEDFVEKARGNRFFEVAGDKKREDGDAPAAPALSGRVDDKPENAAFASVEQLNARREASQEKADSEPTEDPHARRGPQLHQAKKS